jgi:hypothetical protein
MRSMLDLGWARSTADLVACLCLAGTLSRHADRVVLRANVDRFCR